MHFIMHLTTSKLQNVGGMGAHLSKWAMEIVCYDYEMKFTIHACIESIQ